MLHDLVYGQDGEREARFLPCAHERWRHRRAAFGVGVEVRA
jgi:hypothetical protein